MKKFTEVDFKNCYEFSEKLPDHEILLSFNNDFGAYAFYEWWNEKGAMQFNKWLKNSKEFKSEYEE